MKTFVLWVTCCIVCVYGQSQTPSPDTRLALLQDSLSCKIGACAISQDGTALASLNAGDRFPMQSVFKFPIALAVLSKVDEGTLKMDRKIRISDRELAADTWSPIKQRYPEGAELTIAEILGYTVSQSDNIGCDVLLELIGGPAAVQRYLSSHGFSDIAIAANEADMHRDWNEQFHNWCTPQEMTRLLKAVWENTGGLLSNESHAFLWKIMTETSTGSERLKGLLPADVTVAHKTGSSGFHNGVAAGTNDVGTIQLPDGKVVFISVFVADSKESEATNERIIAEIARMVYEEVAR